MIYERDRISLLAQYEQPEMHRHYAKHLIISEMPFSAIIEGKLIATKSIFIQSNVVHEIKYDASNAVLVMLIDESSKLSDAIDEEYLKGNSYVSNLHTMEGKLIGYLRDKDLKKADEAAIHEILGEENRERQIDPAILKALQYAQNLEIIDETCFSKMAAEACLSKSRFSHLFKETMHIDCKNYLLQKKFEKAFMLLTTKGYSITDAAMGAGFSSSSHIATAFKDHFGISISRFIKEQDIRLIK